MKKRHDWVARAIDGAAVATGGGLLALYVASDRVAWFLLGAAFGGLGMRLAHRKTAAPALGLRN